MGADKASVSRSPAIIRCADVLFTILTWHFCGMTDRHTIFFASRPTGAGATTDSPFSRICEQFAARRLALTADDRESRHRPGASSRR